MHTPPYPQTFWMTSLSAGSLWALLLLCPMLPACDDEAATFISVTVTAKDGVANKKAHSPSRLEVRFNHEGDSLPGTLSLEGGIEFPTSFVLKADGRQGQAEIIVRALDDEDLVLGEGSANILIEPLQAVSGDLELFPCDFQVNANYQYNQIFTTDFGGITPSGRQISSSASGDFVIVWENKHSELSRFDIYYRLFDHLSQPKQNSQTDKNEEHSANNSSDQYDMPTVAVRADGHFVVAWQRYLLNEDVFEIFSRSFLPDGRPDPASNSIHENRLTDDVVHNGATASAPHIAVLPGGGYVVVWQQHDPASWDIRGRLLDDSGVPSKQGSPFIVTPAFPFNETFPLPVVAAREDDGFLVVWNQNGALMGRGFDEGAVPLESTEEQGIFQIDSAQSGQVMESDISPLMQGFAVIWSDRVATGPDTEGSCIRLRRVELDGTPMGGEEMTVNTSYAGDQRYPALARAPGGTDEMGMEQALLAVWATDYPDPDPQGGIRGRSLLTNGLPLDMDFPINTTTTGIQGRPAVAPRSKTSFTVAFEDGSESPPDTLGSGIRARLVYPELNPQNGTIGARCEVERPCTGSRCCDPGLICSPTSALSRCITQCVKEGDSCPQGGTCKIDPTMDEYACVYE